jgi:hypothetical protein
MRSAASSMASYFYVGFRVKQMMGMWFDLVGVF